MNSINIMMNLLNGLNGGGLRWTNVGKNFYEIQKQLNEQKNLKIKYLNSCENDPADRTVESSVRRMTWKWSTSTAW